MCIRDRAYLALQRANVTLGMCAEFAQAIPVDESLDIDLRSVMGVELPVEMCIRDSAYADAFEGVTMGSLRRWQIEILLREHLSNNFASLCRYEKSIGDGFYKYFVTLSDVDMLLHSGRYLNLSLRHISPASIARQRIIDISFFIFFPFREDYCGLTRFVHYTKPEHSSQHGQKKEEPHLCDSSIGWFVI